MSQVIHLLRPKEYRVWCRPKAPPYNLAVTNRPLKANCASCLTRYRASTLHLYGEAAAFRKEWTLDYQPPRNEEL